MDRMEMVEVLREKSGCSYAEAKAALEESGDDLLEALCWLESHGKTRLAGASCSTADREPPKEEPQPEEKPKKDGPFVRGCKDLWQGIKDLFRWANRNELVMNNRDGKKELSIPLTIVVVVTILAFWLVLALAVVALFCGMRFSFTGPMATDGLNDAMGKATDFAEGLKQEIREDGFMRDKEDEDKKE